jgi:hypothetical protein
MEKLKALQIKKLIKELDYTEIEFEYTNEAVSEADSSFIRSLNDTLEKHPDLKNKYNKILDDSLRKSIDNIKKSPEELEEGVESNIENNQKEKDDDINEAISLVNKSEPSKKVKKLYRDIVKLTHPDKVKDKELNSLYIEANNYYNNNDKIGIYKVCNELNIYYSIDEEDENSIRAKIEELKKKISFLESTFTWMWFKTDNIEDRERIILQFIYNKIK